MAQQIIAVVCIALLAGLHVGCTGVVGNSDGRGAALRRRPRTGDRLTAWTEGTRMEAIGPAVGNEGQLWAHVRDPRGNEGYMPMAFRVPANWRAEVACSGETSNPLIR